MARSLNLFVLAALVVLAAPVRAAWLTSGNPICTAPGDQRFPVVETDGAVPFVVWTDERDGTRQLYASCIPGGAPAAGWPVNGLHVAPTAWSQSIAAVATTYDPATFRVGAFIVWSEDRGTGTLEDLYGQVLYTDGTRDPAWPITGRLLCGAPGSQGQPRLQALSLTPATTLLTWQDYRSGSADVYALALARDGTPRSGWPVNGVALTSDPGPDEGLSGSAPSTGGNLVWLAWARQNQVHVDRLDFASDGSFVRMGPDGIVVSDPAAYSSWPVLAGDGAGHAVVLWSEFHADHYSVFARGLGDAFGTPAVTDAQPLTVGVNSNEHDPVLAPTSNGVVVTWIDDRNGNDDLYSQTLWTRDLPSGFARTGDPLGTPVCVATGSQGALAAGLFTYWVDPRSGSTDSKIYSAGGLPLLWPTNGLAIAPAAGAQTRPAVGIMRPLAIPEDPDPNFDIVAWSDTRNATSGRDIYAQAVHYRGPGDINGGVPPRLPSSLALSAARPNPTSAGTTLELSLPRDAEVSARVLDAAGRRVRELVRGPLPAGRHPLAWDGLDDRGTSTPAGVYFVRVQVGAEARVSRLARLSK